MLGGLARRSAPAWRTNGDSHRVAAWQVLSTGRVGRYLVRRPLDADRTPAGVAMTTGEVEIGALVVVIPIRTRAQGVDEIRQLGRVELLAHALGVKQVPRKDLNHW